MCTWCWSICATPTSTASRPRTGCTTIGITVNRNAVPFDPRPPMVTSGLRIGTPALATRGFGDDEFAEVADIIAAALSAPVGPLEAVVAGVAPGSGPGHSSSGLVSDSLKSLRLPT